MHASATTVDAQTTTTRSSTPTPSASLHACSTHLAFPQSLAGTQTRRLSSRADRSMAKGASPPLTTSLQTWTTWTPSPCASPRNGVRFLPQSLTAPSRPDSLSLLDLCKHQHLQLRTNLHVPSRRTRTQRTLTGKPGAPSFMPPTNDSPRWRHWLQTPAQPQRSSRTPSSACSRTRWMRMSPSTQSLQAPHAGSTPSAHTAVASSPLLPWRSSKKPAPYADASVPLETLSNARRSSDAPRRHGQRVKPLRSETNTPTSTGTLLRLRGSADVTLQTYIKSSSRRTTCSMPPTTDMACPQISRVLTQPTTALWAPSPTRLSLHMMTQTS